ncbi:MAG: 50S ribosomal protein L35 [Deltaproteobacteria bacterium]|nr:50S ribosomal protein L35 [Deltaproteobacteria bacterium]
MPKLKTNRGAAKRFRLTAKGKVKTKRCNHSHILTKKTTKRKRNLRKPGIIATPDRRSISRLLPYA